MLTNALIVLAIGVSLPVAAYGMELLTRHKTAKLMGLHKKGAPRA